MNNLSNHNFMEVHPMHYRNQPQQQHQSHCKQQCFVFTDLADIVELPPHELTKITTEKLVQNGTIGTMPFSKDPCGNACNHGSVFNTGVSGNGTDLSVDATNSKKRCRRLIIVLGLMILCIFMAGGIPLALQLRQSSLLEARLTFIRRLLSEAPLIQGFWQPTKHINYSGRMNEMRQKYVGAILWPIPVPCGAQYLDAVQLALEGIDNVRRITVTTTSMHIVESANEMEQTHLLGEVAILMGIGGGHALGTSLAVLRSMYLLGARFISITSLECATPWAASTRSPNYLFVDNVTNSMNDFGKTMLFEMNRIGMLAEISYLSLSAMTMVLKTSKAPVLLTNAAPTTFCNSSNIASIPDNILSLLPENGGVIMLNLESCGGRLLTVREAINAINYVRKIAGVDHIGLGGVPKGYAFLLAELARDRIWGNAAIKKIIGGNIVRILRDVEMLKDRLPLSEEWIPHQLIESNSYCRYPES